jgi:uncharacterized protein YndB with AHSA1/START domain
MADKESIFEKTIIIQAQPSIVWGALTNQESMKKWMFETAIDIVTDWQVGNPFLIHGNLHSTYFENKGTVLQFKKEEVLEYSHLNSLSALPDEPANYSTVAFRLTPIENQTSLTLTLRNFPTEEIYKHLVFYWNVTMEILKKWIEKQWQQSF